MISHPRLALSMTIITIGEGGALKAKCRFTNHEMQCLSLDYNNKQCH